MKDTVQIIVPRTSADENTFAVVTAERTNKIQDGHDLKVAIRAAVTDWIENISKGCEAWERSAHDFNVGDLCTELGDETLSHCLRSHSVEELEIETFCCVYPFSWTFDEILYG